MRLNGCPDGPPIVITVVPDVTAVVAVTGAALEGVLVHAQHGVRVGGARGAQAEMEFIRTVYVLLTYTYIYLEYIYIYFCIYTQYGL